MCEPLSKTKGAPPLLTLRCGPVLWNYYTYITLDYDVTLHSQVLVLEPLVNHRLIYKQIDRYIQKNSQIDRQLDRHTNG